MHDQGPNVSMCTYVGLGLHLGGGGLGKHIRNKEILFVFVAPQDKVCPHPIISLYMMPP